MSCAKFLQTLRNLQ